MSEISCIDNTTNHPVPIVGNDLADAQDMLADVIEIAENNNPAFAAANAELETAEAQLEIALEELIEARGAGAPIVDIPAFEAARIAAENAQNDVDIAQAARDALRTEAVIQAEEQLETFEIADPIEEAEEEEVEEEAEEEEVELVDLIEDAAITAARDTAEAARVAANTAANEAETIILENAADVAAAAADDALDAAADAAADAEEDALNELGDAPISPEIAAAEEELALAEEAFNDAIMMEQNAVNEARINEQTANDMLDSARLSGNMDQINEAELRLEAAETALNDAENALDNAENVASMGPLGQAVENAEAKLDALTQTAENVPEIPLPIPINEDDTITIIIDADGKFNINIQVPNLGEIPILGIERGAEFIQIPNVCEDRDNGLIFRCKGEGQAPGSQVKIVFVEPEEVDAPTMFAIENDADAADGTAIANNDTPVEGEESDDESTLFAATQNQPTTKNIHTLINEAIDNTIAIMYSLADKQAIFENEPSSITKQSAISAHAESAKLLTLCAYINTHSSHPETNAILKYLIEFSVMIIQKSVIHI